MVDNKQQGTKVSERVQALNLQIAEQDKQKEEQKNQKKSKAKEGLYSPYMSEERKKELEDAKKHHKDTIKSADDASTEVINEQLKRVDKESPCKLIATGFVKNAKEELTKKGLHT